MPDSLLILIRLICLFLSLHALLVIRKLSPQQFAVSKWGRLGEHDELQQPGAQLIDILQPRTPEEDLLLRGGPQQGPLWPTTGPRRPPLPRFQPCVLHGPVQSSDNEPLPPQPRTDAGVPRTPNNGSVPQPGAAPPAGQLRHGLPVTPTGQVSWFRNRTHTCMN